MHRAVVHPSRSSHKWWRNHVLTVVDIAGGVSSCMKGTSSHHYDEVAPDTINSPAQGSESLSHHYDELALMSVTGHEQGADELPTQNLSNSHQYSNVVAELSRTFIDEKEDDEQFLTWDDSSLPFTGACDPQSSYQLPDDDQLLTFIEENFAQPLSEEMKHLATLLKEDEGPSSNLQTDRVNLETAVTNIGLWSISEELSESQDQLSTIEVLSSSNLKSCRQPVSSRMCQRSPVNDEDAVNENHATASTRQPSPLLRKVGVTEDLLQSLVRSNLWPSRLAISILEEPSKDRLTRFHVFDVDATHRFAKHDEHAGTIRICLTPGKILVVLNNRFQEVSCAVEQDARGKEAFWICLAQGLADYCKPLICKREVSEEIANLGKSLLKEIQYYNRLEWLYLLKAGQKTKLPVEHLHLNDWSESKYLEEAIKKILVKHKGLKCENLEEAIKEIATTPEKKTLKSQLKETCYKIANCLKALACRQ